MGEVNKKYNPHIVVFEHLHRWQVEELSYEEDALERFNYLVGKADTVILAKRIRKHAEG